MYKKLWLILIAVCECLSEENPTVVTKSGKIVGHYLTSSGGNKYEAYQGIPYALPPTEKRRFKSPVPVTPWSDELVANKLRSACWQEALQPFPSGSFFDGDEDCLYLNVFVPDTKSNDTLPVLFYIHGGGFRTGHSLLGEETFLMDYNVILVTVQYRLGLFGFLSTKDHVVPGNMGLKDQSLALRWVHENICSFGGNPNKITLYGSSAGGTSVHYHYLSPMSAGLFQNGISYSGTAFQFWAQTPQNPLANAIKLGRLMNCTTSGIERMISCLRERPARNLATSQLQFMADAIILRPFDRVPSEQIAQQTHLKTDMPFGPVVEISSEDPFIDQSAREIVASGRAYDVPWITGVVNYESPFFSPEWYDDDVTLKWINDSWNQILPSLLGYYDTIPKENHTKLALAVRKQYFGDKPVNKDTFLNLMSMLGDRWFYVDFENSVRAQAAANKSPVFLYRYSYRANQSEFKMSNLSKYQGAFHDEDVHLFMKNEYVAPPKSQRDILMQKDLIEILISFAAKGTRSLNANWSRVDPTTALNYLDISGPGLGTMESIDHFGQGSFWNSIEFQVK